MVDIIFVCYNNRKDIKRCFTTLERYTESYNNVILIDNNSNVKTIKTIVRYKSILKKGNFIFQRNSKNLGYAYALNQGIKISISRYLIFANLDIAFTEGWLQPLIHELKKDEVAFVGGKILDRHKRLNSCGIGGTEKNRYHRGWGEKDRGQYDKIEEVISVSGALFGSKREIFDKIGFFDENFFLYFEETEMHIRARRAGYKIIYTPYSRIIHYLGGSPKKRGDKSRWFKESEKYFNKKLGF